MQIQTLLEQGTGKTNEDTLITDRTMFGVFDGATSLVDQNLPTGTTGGLMAARTASRVFARNGGSLVTLARHANSAILRQMLEHGVDCSLREALWSTSAAVVRIDGSGDFMEWVQTGDSPIVLLYRDGSRRILGETRDQDFETLSMWRSMALSTPLTIRQALSGQILRTRKRMNRTYGVLNGEPEAEHFLHSGVEPLEDVTDILLFTDGLALPTQNPGHRKSYDSLVDLYLSLGLEKLKNHIRALEATDPQCRLYPRFKCHDDIAAIAIRLEKDPTFP